MIANPQAHYGFTRMPFGTAVPAGALYASAAHNEAVARLRWLISARGLGALTGEVGSGKTVAVRAAVAGLDASRYTLIYLPNPQIGPTPCSPMMQSAPSTPTPVACPAP
jgi:type II secretory pathway predicted ATPase ExeA